MYKNFLLIIFIALLVISCNDDDVNVSNSFAINGTEYATDFAYTTGGNGSPRVILIFSNADRTNSSYVETRGRFDIRYGTTFTPGTYLSNTGGFGDVFEFTQGIEKVDGSFISSGENLAFSSSGSGGFQSASATVNSLSLNAQGQVTQIDIDYTITFDSKEIRGNYNGNVRLDPQ